MLLLQLELPRRGLGRRRPLRQGRRRHRRAEPGPGRRGPRRVRRAWSTCSSPTRARRRCSRASPTIPSPPRRTCRSGSTARVVVTLGGEGSLVLQADGAARVRARPTSSTSSTPSAPATPTAAASAPGSPPATSLLDAARYASAAGVPLRHPPRRRAEHPPRRSRSRPSSPPPTPDLETAMSALPTTDLEVLLTDGQIAEFHEQGFTHVERLTTDDEVEWLREQLRVGLRPEEREPVRRRLLRRLPPDGLHRSSSSARRCSPRPIRPELVITELHETIVHRNADADRRAAARPRRGRARAVDPHDRQAAPHRPRHAVAPGRGVLGAGPRLPRLRGVARPRRRRRGQRLHAVHARLPPAGHRHPPPPLRRPDGQRAGDRRRRRVAGRARAAQGRRGHVPHPDDDAPHRPERHRPPPPGLRHRGPAPARGRSTPPRSTPGRPDLGTPTARRSRR